jgi:four helix bundle protein
MRIAGGSASELEYHLLLARDLGFLLSDLHCEITAKICEVKQMLTSYTKKLRGEFE